MFGQVKESLTLDLHVIIRVSCAVACPINFILLCELVQHGGVLRLMKNSPFLSTLAV